MAPLPELGPTDVELVKAQLSMTSSTEDDYVGTVVAAVNDVVRDMPIVADLVAADADAFPDRVVLGATMLGARLVRRRNSPSGIEAMTDQGVAYVSRNDPDIAQLLRLGAYAKPRVG